MKTVLVTARMFGHISEEAFDVFHEKGIKIAPNPYRGSGLNEDQLIELLPGVDVLLTGVDKVTEKVIERGDQLIGISKFGAGIDNIDVDAATRHGIIVTKTPGTNANAVADHAFALMLSVARKVNFAYSKIKNGEWPKLVSGEVWGKNLGLIGLGKIGQAVALRAKGFNMQILAYEPKPDSKFISENDIQLATLDQVLSDSDYISLHVPHNKQTDKLISDNEFQIMKPDAVIINTARGGVVDEVALYRALTDKGIAGAGLDVFEVEPPGDSPLLALDNFVATPHMGMFSKEAIQETEKLSAQNAIDVLEGKIPEHVVNPDVKKFLKDKPPR